MQQTNFVMNGLADVDGFKKCIQVCVWMDFPPLFSPNLGKSQQTYYYLFVQTFITFYIWGFETCQIVKNKIPILCIEIRKRFHF